MEEQKAKGKTFYASLLDLTDAYTSTDLDILEKLLIQAKAPTEIKTPLINKLRSYKIKAETGRGITKAVAVLKGLLQGGNCHRVYLSFM